MATQLLDETESLCPECLRKIPARKVVREGNVYIEKTCPSHGDYEALLWRNAQLYSDWGRYAEETTGPEEPLTQVVKGCPYDCGLCPQHKADTCLAVMEVTNGCNLHCPVCFASAGGNADYEPSLEVIKDMYNTIIECNGQPCPVQISGGEPTVRDDLPDIIALGREMGFSEILVNTNGVRLAADEEYFWRLKESGATGIYLQFDGVSDDVYLHTRGAKLAELKLEAISNAADLKIAVILVPTLVPGVNEHQVGDIIQAAKKWMPVIKGVHFQPVSYFGRYPKPPKDEDRITIPDVLNALESQLKGEVVVRDFMPRRRQDAHCAFSGLFVLSEDEQLLAITEFPREGVSKAHFKTPGEQARRFINQKWRFAEESKNPGTICECKSDSVTDLFERARTHTLSISGMPFQDVWNIDLQRLQGCCIHVVSPARRLIPLCAFYLTSLNGERLYSQGELNRRGNVSG